MRTSGARDAADANTTLLVSHLEPAVDEDRKDSPSPAPEGLVDVAPVEPVVDAASIVSVAHVLARVFPVAGLGDAVVAVA
jgi:hypothetical protein